MKFIIEKKGEKYLVVNDTTKDVRGVHKTPGEAKVHAKELQTKFNNGVTSVSSRITPPKAVSEDDRDDDGE